MFYPLLMAPRVKSVSLGVLGLIILIYKLFISPQLEREVVKVCRQRGVLTTALNLPSEIPPCRMFNPLISPSPAQPVLHLFSPNSSIPTAF